MNEYVIPVMFDVTAESEEQAARMLANYLAERFTPTGDFPCRGIESWFYPLQGHKRIDRNDRPAYAIEEAER